MSQSILDAQELDAIRASMGEPGRARLLGGGAESQAAPIPLIADDRAAERARPFGLTLAQRLGAVARDRIARRCGVKLEAGATGCEILDGATARAQLAGAWLAGVKLRGRPGLVLLAVTGPLVEALPVKLLGGAARSAAPPVLSDEPSPPTAATLRMFAPIGDALAGALADTLLEESGLAVERTDAAAVEGARRGLATWDTAMWITSGLKGLAEGQLIVIARPDTLVGPPAPPQIVPAPRGAVERVMGAVPVEVRVELGIARMSLGALSSLRAGALLDLELPPDGLLPVRVGGVVKAHGRPTVSRGAIAVEIVTTEEK